MIKAKMNRIRGKQGEAYLLGLSEENLKLLRQRRPIVINLESLDGPDIEIVIIWGETENAIKLELSELGLFNDKTEFTQG